MSSDGQTILIGLVTFLVSIITSAFIAGARWGQVRTQIQQMQREAASYATKADVQHLAELAAELKGMFELRPRGKRGAPR